jgi:hypothetical protein
MEVTSPFGQENFMVFKGTALLREINFETVGEIHKKKTQPEKIAIRNGGVSLEEKNPGQKIGTADLFCFTCI